ncbi:fungal-specific transcription factor domain-domain-containing protein [Microdochium bolleyi]|uniref:Fungal-specific transcription factor domain-domain-containing protein n=1 Tax=Microdochium bolleyi TaxID=196109 RepID=A0A136IL85_9PEZI|nr:fungal-specific transcription factor domain-domain-containing protein [Microdochium bolleyi]
MSDAVVRFLQDAGAFELPCLSTQKLLLKAFFDFVQPALPVTSYQQYEDVFDVQHGGISLLLYVAMLFAGSLYADQVQLSLDGYTDRWQLMQDLFEKAKNLYNMDYEQDRLALVQCSLLMSLWSERTLSNQQSSFYWMNIAISIAHDMNLHTEASSRGLKARASQLRRKLWWCCVMRDSLIALGRCSAPQIRDHDVPMLRVADFADAETSRVLPSTIAAEQAKTLAELCVQRAKLSLHLNRALRLRYSQHHSDPGPVVEGSSKLIRQDYIHTTNRALAAWHKALPLACRYQALPALAVPQPLEVTSKTTAAAGADSVLVLRSFLHMQYHATVSTLNRPISILPCCSSKESSHANTPHACENTPSELANRKRTQDSANHVIQVAAELHRHRLDKFLPTTSTAMIVQALLVHTMQSAALQNGADYRPNRDVLQAIRVLDEMRQRSVFSHVAARYLESGMGRPGAPSRENGSKLGAHVKMNLSQTNIKASRNPPTPPSTIQPLASPQWSDYQQMPAVESSKLPATSVLTPASVLIGQDQHNYNRTESVNSGTSMTSIEHQVSAVPDLFSPSIFDWDLDLNGIDPAWMEISADYLHGGDDGVTARLDDHLGMHDEQLGLPMFDTEALDMLIIM